MVVGVVVVVVGIIDEGVVEDVVGFGGRFDEIVGLCVVCGVMMGVDGWVDVKVVDIVVIGGILVECVVNLLDGEVIVFGCFGGGGCSVLVVECEEGGVCGVVKGVLLIELGEVVWGVGDVLVVVVVGLVIEMMFGVGFVLGFVGEFCE